MIQIIILLVTLQWYLPLIWLWKLAFKLWHIVSPHVEIVFLKWVNTCNKQFYQMMDIHCQLQEEVLDKQVQ